MTQNRSSAVMQQRNMALDKFDDFPTQPFAARALCEWLQAECGSLGQLEVDEPAANRGYMARPLAEYFKRVVTSDIFDYGLGYQVEDYLFPGNDRETDWTITNPPFRLAQQFIEKARRTSSRGVAMFVRSAFLEGQERFGSLYSVDPPHVILQFTERVVIHRGKVVDPNIALQSTDAKTGKVKMKKPASATAYSWLVWLGPHRRNGRPEFDWIPPCRKRLERPGDYDLPEVLPR